MISEAIKLLQYAWSTGVHFYVEGTSWVNTTLMTFEDGQWFIFHFIPLAELLYT